MKSIIVFFIVVILIVSCKKTQEQQQVHNYCKLESYKLDSVKVFSGYGYPQPYEIGYWSYIEDSSFNGVVTRLYLYEWTMTYLSTGGQPTFPTTDGKCF